MFTMFSRTSHKWKLEHEFKNSRPKFSKRTVYKIMLCILCPQYLLQANIQGLVHTFFDFHRKHFHFFHSFLKFVLSWGCYRVNFFITSIIVFIWVSTENLRKVKKINKYFRALPFPSKHDIIKRKLLKLIKGNSSGIFRDPIFSNSHQFSKYCCCKTVPSLHRSNFLEVSKELLQRFLYCKYTKYFIEIKGIIISLI